MFTTTEYKISWIYGTRIETDYLSAKAFIDTHKAYIPCNDNEGKII